MLLDMPSALQAEVSVYTWALRRSRAQPSASVFCTAVSRLASSTAATSLAFSWAKASRILICTCTGVQKSLCKGRMSADTADPGNAVDHQGQQEEEGAIREAIWRQSPACIRAIHEFMSGPRTALAK
eukprot:1145666-Pelagomonas_calceolata.AAC.2